jgi:hypothetical protein|tara:strand:- start:195 stop:470 length:276 start_codon:yes stop_codon:yes gene_type:complete
MTYQIQDAITDYIDEQVESVVEDKMLNASEVQDLRNDVSDLQARLDEEVTNEVVRQVIEKLMSTLDGDYVMVKRSHLQDLKTRATESKNVA